MDRASMAHLMVHVLIASWLIRHCAGKEGFVTEVLDGVRSSCIELEKTVYDAPSEIQCIHKCIQAPRCSTINYRHGSNTTKGNCEIFAGGYCTRREESKNWKTVVVKDKLFQPKASFKSCKEIFLARPSAVSGVYELESGLHFCRMDDIPGCGGGGWTLAMKIDGNKDTFTVSSTYWVNDVVYNTELGLKSFNESEAKFPAFSNVTFDDICIGMMDSTSTVNWVRILQQQPSLLELFKSNTYTETRLGKTVWKSLIAQSSLQPYCDREGFNVLPISGTPKIRIGLIANNEDDCNSPDSYIGLGGLSIPCGNSATSSHNDNGEKTLRAICFVLVK